VGNECRVSRIRGFVSRNRGLQGRADSPLEV
jgi:hypothetical protein